MKLLELKHIIFTSKILGPMSFTNSLQYALDDAPAIQDIFSIPDIDGGVSRLHRGIASITINEQTLIAVSCGSIMTILRRGSDSSHSETFECLGDLEFDSPINSVSWDPVGRCILVAQSNGQIHFSLPTGSLLLSHSIISGEQCFLFTHYFWF